MIPQRLTLRNFMSYREEATLDFSRLQMACLAGENGAGKSALLDAITWAIWGKTRASSDRDVIAIGATEMEVTFTFEFNDREYRVFRRRSIGSAMRQSLEFDVREPGTVDWYPITGDNVRDTEHRIVTTLNLDYDTFVNSAFFVQGRADSFAEMPPSNRKQVLAEILNLGEYDELLQLTRADVQRVDQDVHTARSRLADLDRRLVERPSKQAELEAASAQLIELGGRLDTTQALVRSLAGLLQAHAHNEELLRLARTRLHREQQAIQDIERDILALERERVERADLLVRAAEIEAGAADHERWSARTRHFAETLILVREHEASRVAAERELAAAETELRLRLDRLATRLRQLHAQREQIDRDASELERLRTEAAAAEAELADLPGIRARIESLRSERAELTADNNQIKGRYAEIRDNLERITGGEGECPVCRTPLSPGDRERISMEWQDDQHALSERITMNRARIAAIDIEGKSLTERETLLVQLDRGHAGTLTRIRHLESSVSEHGRVEQELRAEEAVSDATEREHAGQQFAPDARRRLADAKAELAALAYDQAAHEQASARERENAHWVERLRRLETARIELAGIDQQLFGLRAQHTQRAESANDAMTEIERLERQLVELPDLHRQHDDARDECDRLELARAEAQSRFGAAQNALEQLDAIAIEREEIAARADALALEAGALRELVEAFGRNGIQAMIVENVLPELQEHANAILRRMSSGALHVSFKSQREAQSREGVIETLDIIIRDERGERPYALYSGGEAFRINFAVRVALSRLLARRAGARIGMLVIDEGFGSQDSRGRDGLLEALHSVESDFERVIVITHMNEIRELFPTRVDVVKTERGSMISVA